MIIEHQRLRGIMARILRAGGANEDEATCTADHMVDANLAGHDSHGVGMLPLYCRSIEGGNLRPGQQPEIVSDSGTIAVWDGHGGIGQVIARDAMRWAIPAARKHGIAVHALRNAHHIGRVGTYGEMCAAEGLVSVHFVNGIGTAPIVAPFNGREPRYTTNPICIGVPGTAKTPAIILDFATSRLAVGKIRVAHNMRKQVPEGVLLTHDGKHTTDPDVIFSEPRGMLMPFGEHKGSGLALVCDLLCGAIMGMGTLRQDAAPIRGGVYNGMLSFVLDPSRLSSRAFMEQEIDALIAWAKSSARLDPEVPVLVAGEPERIARAQRLAEGIPIDENTWAEIREAADKLQVRIDS
jgi:hydroxycarboxylate dehydrogenase B